MTTLDTILAIVGGLFFVSFLVCWLVGSVLWKIDQHQRQTLEDYRKENAQ